MRALLIIPAFNEAGAIAGVVQNVRQHFSGDVLVIDDGSEDDTSALARAAGARVVRHPCNLGIGAAVAAAAYPMHIVAKLPIAATLPREVVA